MSSRGRGRSLIGHVREPVTLITDWILGGLAAYWAAALVVAGAQRGEAGSATIIWGSAFAATAVAAVLGGAIHGFQHRMHPRSADMLWRTTLHLVTLGSAAMLAAVLLAAPATPVTAPGLALIGVKLLAVSVLLIRRPAFRIALVDYGLSMAAVLAVQATAWNADRAASALWIIGGIALSALAGAIQAGRLAPHPRFNHNDLYHVVQIGALWLLYRGGLLLGAG